MGLIGDIDDNILLAIVVVVLLLVLFSEQVSYLLHTLGSLVSGKHKLPCGCYGNCDGDCKDLVMPDEHFSDVVTDASNPNTVRGGDSDVLKALGYEDGADMSWDAMIKVTEIDPSIHRNHENFVADVRRFSSGANFTSVADDNTRADYTNFVGLRRPQHVEIMPDARQRPDVETSVLQRNKPLIW